MFNIIRRKGKGIEVTMRKEGYQIPQVDFVFRENGE
jgi:hypothetical protein